MVVTVTLVDWYWLNFTHLLFNLFNLLDNYLSLLFICDWVEIKIGKIDPVIVVLVLDYIEYLFPFGVFRLNVTIPFINPLREIFIYQLINILISAHFHSESLKSLKWLVIFLYFYITTINFYPYFFLVIIDKFPNFCSLFFLHFLIMF